MTDDNILLDLKRKASDTAAEASPVIKRPRLSMTSESPAETGITANLSCNGTGHDNHRDARSSVSSFSVPWSEGQRVIASPPGQEVTPFQGQGGKGKALNFYSDPSPETLPNPSTIPSSSKDKKPLSVFRGLPKGKTSSLSSNGSWNPTRSGSSLDKQRRRESFVVDLTQQDAISISSDSEDGQTGVSSTYKRPPGNGTSQADAIDLTLDLDEGDIIIIDASPEPLPFKELDFDSDSTSISTRDPQSIPSFIPSASPMHSHGYQPSGGLQDAEPEATAVQSAIEPDAVIVEHPDTGHDSPSETLAEETPGLIVPRETSRDISGALDEHRASEPPRSPMIKPPSPSPPSPIHPKNEDITISLVDPIAGLQIDADRNTSSEDEISQPITPEETPLTKQEEENSPGNFHAPGLLSDESTLNTPRTPDNELLPSRPTFVKEPDFSKIDAGATEPVPDYTNRLAAAIKWPAEKLPTELHDMINRLPPHHLFNPQMKHIFEAMIEDNTADDEPQAPKISIIGRKNGPVTPPWEFYYTNRIVYGEGVPRSDKKLLQGCDCIGPCDPKSKTCACVQRQMAWTGGEIKGFLYKKERLLHPHYPVFECNDACECSEECTNRVVQNGRKHRISIVLTKNKGWGVFAEEKIPRGTYLGIYAGEIILEAEADERGKLYDRYGRTYLFDVDFYHLRSLDKDANKGKDEERTNTYTIDAFHVGNFTRFLNHSCDPNCQITATYVNEPDVRKPALTIFTSRDIQKGEEITFAYFGEADEEEVSDEELEDKTVKVGAGPSPHKQQAVHRRCLCGASNCRGQMF